VPNLTAAELDGFPGGRLAFESLTRITNAREVMTDDQLDWLLDAAEQNERLRGLLREAQSFLRHPGVWGNSPKLDDFRARIAAELQPEVGEGTDA
jgi:hypothetical protein